MFPNRSKNSSKKPGTLSSGWARTVLCFSKPSLAAGVLAPVSKSITHTHAVKEAAQAGARGLMLTQFRDDMLIYGGIEADFESIAPTCKALAETFEKGKHLHLTTKKGTDFDAVIEGRQGNALTCLVGPGQFSPVPNVEANVSPLEGTASGRLVIDASIPYIDIGSWTIPSKSRWTMEKSNRFEAGNKPTSW